MQLFLLLGFSSFLLSLILTPLCRDFFRRLGVLDHPGEIRKIHVEAVPRIGGIPLILSLALSFALTYALPESYREGAPVLLVWKLSPGILLVFAIGLLDDLVRLRPWHKLAGESVAAGWAYAVGVQVSGFAGFSTDSWLTLPLTVLWLVLCANAFNLIDGVDGLSAGLGLFATFTMLIAALVLNNVPLAVVTAPLAGCLLGFLRYNFNPATVFLGDSGSLLIGFLLGCYGVIWSQKTATLLGLVAPMMALFVPLLDVALSVARRFLRHQPIFSADRGHIHHRLLERGFSPRKAVLVLYGVCALGAMLSLVQTVVRNQYGNLIVLLFCAAAWLGVQHLGYVEFNVARNLVLGGAFRRLINAQVQLRQFEQDLDGAGSLEECWRVLQGACNSFGYTGLKLAVDGRVFEQISAAHGEDCWSVRIPLEGNSYVKLMREFGESPHAAVVAPLAEIIRGRLCEKLPSLRRYVEIREPLVGAAVAGGD